MPKRRPSQEFIAAITVQDDGIWPVREAGHWTRDKLGILVSYLQRYGVACQRARRFYFVDAMAGSGLCHFLPEDDFLKGSTQIALSSSPEFAKCLALEIATDSAAALRLRVASYGPRAAVVTGDCNRLLASAMAEHIPRNYPSFILLDPEGAELEWSTVKAAASHRIGPRKAELLILFATEGVNRMLPVETSLELHNEMRLNQLFPPEAKWRQTWLQRKGDEITPAAARRLYVDGYARGLTALGYKHVLNRQITRASGALVYDLLFATDDDTGEKIMRDVFENMFPNRPQLPLF